MNNSISNIDVEKQQFVSKTISSKKNKGLNILGILLIILFIFIFSTLIFSIIYNAYNKTDNNNLLLTNEIILVSGKEYSFTKNVEVKNITNRTVNPGNYEFNLNEDDNENKINIKLTIQDTHLPNEIFNIALDINGKLTTVGNRRLRFVKI